MNKSSNQILILMFVVFMQFSNAQDCSRSSMQKILEHSTTLQNQDEPGGEKLEEMKKELEKIINNCDLDEDILLAYNFVDNLITLCGLIGDIEGKVSWLDSVNVPKYHSARAEKYKDPLEEIEFVKRYYGPLRIRFEDDITKMATLKNKNNKDISIHFLPPQDAWIGRKNRNEMLQRVDYLKRESQRGNLKLFFDSYDTKDKYFYFELPYVPYLDESESSSDWYAITFDNTKRYRINFSESGGEKTRSLTIKPEKGWYLETSTPEKWLKFTFTNNAGKIKFEDRETGKKLKEGDYIKINNSNNIDYYVPSDKKIEVIFPHKGKELFNSVGKFIYSGLFVGICYFTFSYQS